MRRQRCAASPDDPGLEGNSVMSKITRREFIRRVGLMGAGAAALSAGCRPTSPAGGTDDTPQVPTATNTPMPTTDQGEVIATPTFPQPSATATPRSPGTATPTPVIKKASATPTLAPRPTATVAPQPPAAEEPAYLAVARGPDPAAITRAAIDALGGIGRFVKAGDFVIVKPNICVNHNTYEYASTTNPTVVATLVRMCLEAGAKKVRVMDTPYTGDPETAYRMSGIQEAVNGAGGEMEIMSEVKYARFKIPKGRDISAWSVYRDIMEADVLINVPIAKHHSLARLTLGCKNLMGVIKNPGGFHRNLHQRIADLASLIRPALTVVDAVRILTAHGPGGGDLRDVKKMDTVIASHDMIVADAYATTLFGLTPDDIGYIRIGAEMGLGQKDWSGVRVDEIAV